MLCGLDVDVCGRCCVVEEFPLCGGGSTYRINEIERAGDTFLPDNRHTQPLERNTELVRL